MTEHLVESQHEGILVAITESPHFGYHMKELLALGVVPDIAYRRMMRREGGKPVGGNIKEREALHLGETGK